MEDDEGKEDSEGEDEMEEDLEKLHVNENKEENKSELQGASAAGQNRNDDIFTVKIGPQSTSSVSAVQQSNSDTPSLFVPHARMNTLLAVNHGMLYMYGGIYESGDKQITLSDMYSLDLHKLDEWNTIIESDLDTKV